MPVVPSNRTGYVRRTIATCAVFCLSFHGAFALDPAKSITQYIQTSWTSESGLPQNSVHAIAQTADGFLWLGTEEGLARFDGRHFRIYDRRHSGTLASDYIQTLCASRDGSLWIGTDGGLSHFYPDSSVPQVDLGSIQNGRFTTLTTKDGLSGNSISAIDETADGAIWVGTNQGLNRIRGSKIESWTHANGLAGNQVNAIVADSSGALWIATDEDCHASPANGLLLGRQPKAFPGTASLHSRLIPATTFGQASSTMAWCKSTRAASSHPPPNSHGRKSRH